MSELCLRTAKLLMCLMKLRTEKRQVQILGPLHAQQRPQLRVPGVPESGFVQAERVDTAHEPALTLATASKMHLLAELETFVAA